MSSQEDDQIIIATAKQRPKPRLKFGPVDYYDYSLKTKRILYYVLGVPVKAITHLFWNVKYRGKENIPNSPVIFMPNHLSHLDSFVLGLGLWPKRIIHAIADEKLFTHPLPYWFLTNLNAFPIRKGAKQLHIVKYAIDLVKSGKSLIYYPEGSRNRNPRAKKLLPVKVGAGWVAHATQAPVIPVYITGTDKAMPPGKPPTIGGGFRRIKITVNYGKPVDLREYYTMPQSKETSMLIVREIVQAIKNLGEEVENST